MNTKLLHLSSITKKILVALLGTFLLVFVTFHMCANLCILAHDGGSAYTAFCHFMGSNIFVKVLELGLFLILLLHIGINLIIWFENKNARPVGYHVKTKTRTLASSKLMVLTGLLIILCLLLHFMDFYFVKKGLTKGTYMVKTEDIRSETVNYLLQNSVQYDAMPEDIVAQQEEMIAPYRDQFSAEEQQQLDQELEELRNAIPVVHMLSDVYENNRISEDGKYIKQVTEDEKKMLKKAIDGINVEPDFYYMARDLFKNPVMCVLYWAFFVVVWFHLRQAFQAAFQTLGLNNYKYSRAIEIVGIIFAWVICLGFAVIPLGVLLNI